LCESRRGSDEGESETSGCRDKPHSRDHDPIVFQALPDKESYYNPSRLSSSAEMAGRRSGLRIRLRTPSLPKFS
jgi:hypothetical protein